MLEFPSRRGFLPVGFHVGGQFRQPGLASRQHFRRESHELAHIVVDVREQCGDGLAIAGRAVRQVQQQSFSRKFVQLARVFFDAQAGADAGQHGQPLCERLVQRVDRQQAQATRDSRAMPQPNRASRASTARASSRVRTQQVFGSSGGVIAMTQRLENAVTHLGRRLARERDRKHRLGRLDNG